MLRGRNDKVVMRNDKVIVRNDKVIVRNDKVIGRNNKVIGRNDKVIGRTDKVIGRNDKVIGRKDKVIGRNDKVIGRNNKSRTNRTMISHDLAARRDFVRDLARLKVRGGVVLLKDSGRVLSDVGYALLMFLNKVQA